MVLFAFYHNWFVSQEHNISFHVMYKLVIMFYRVLFAGEEKPSHETLILQLSL